MHNDYLEHYGVLGMKWGKRKSGGSSSSSKSSKSRKKVSKKEMSKDVKKNRSKVESKLKKNIKASDLTEKDLRKMQVRSSMDAMFYRDIIGMASDVLTDIMLGN